MIDTLLIKLYNSFGVMSVLQSMQRTCSLIGGVITQGPKEQQSKSLLKAKARAARDNASLVRPVLSMGPSPLIRANTVVSIDQMLQRPNGSQGPAPVWKPRVVPVVIPVPVPVLSLRPARFGEEYEVKFLQNLKL